MLFRRVCPLLICIIFFLGRCTPSAGGHHQYFDPADDSDEDTKERSIEADSISSSNEDDSEDDSDDDSDEDEGDFSEFYQNDLPLFGRSIDQNTGKKKRILGGHKAQPGSHPSIVSLQVYGKHHCGGTIIHPQVILTAAHCIKKDLTILAGIYSLKSPYEGQRKTNSESFIHNQYRVTSFGAIYDIALLYLSPVNRFSYNKNVQAALLPPTGFVPQGDAIVAGWGIYSLKPLSNPDILQEVQIPILDDGMCNSMWDSQLRSEHMICAGGNEKGVCNGDSGGPLYVKSASKEMIVGTVSFGKAGCNLTENTNVYMKVAQLRPWICQVLQVLPGDFSSICPLNWMRQDQNRRPNIQPKKPSDLWSAISSILN